MPIYEYTCGSCQHDFEYLLRGGERAACPQCGSADLHKRFSVPAAHVASSSSLPVCQAPRESLCGRPECGRGGCMME